MLSFKASGARSPVARHLRSSLGIMLSFFRLTSKPASKTQSQGNLQHEFPYPIVLVEPKSSGNYISRFAQPAVKVKYRSAIRVNDKTGRHFKWTTERDDGRRSGRSWAGHIP